MQHSYATYGEQSQEDVRRLALLPLAFRKLELEYLNTIGTSAVVDLLIDHGILQALRKRGARVQPARRKNA